MSLQSKGLPKTVRGNLVVGYTNGKKIKDWGWSDMSTLAKWYQEDPTERHLGLLKIYNQMGTRIIPSYSNYFETRSILEVVGPNGSFKFDIEVEKPVVESLTNGDTSEYSDAPGIDQTLFPIKLDKAYRNGDVITYDPYDGAQAVVAEDRAVEKDGDSWTHWCHLAGDDPSAWFPTDKLVPGIEYVKIGHVLGEYSTQFSGLEGFQTPDTLTCEFVLGNHRGVEAYVTYYANDKAAGASVKAKDFINRWVEQVNALRKDENGRPLDMFYVGNKSSRGNGLVGKTVRLASIYEHLVDAELIRIEAYQNYYQKGGVITDVNGTKRMNEGIVPQLRRGRVIKYSKPGSITKNQLAQATEYLYRNNQDVPVDQRVLKIKAGRMLYENIQALIQKESITQLAGMSEFNGFERVLPKSPVTGNSLTDLQVEPVRFKRVMVSGIGWIECEHDTSFDFQPLTDRGSRGFVGGQGLPTSSYSGLASAGIKTVSDITKKIKDGASVVENGNLHADVYYVKPEGEGFYKGYSEGRWSPNKASDIASSMKHMAREIWAHSTSCTFVAYPDKHILFELKK